MHLLRDMVKADWVSEHSIEGNEEPTLLVAVVDGMAEIRNLNIKNVCNVSELAAAFLGKMLHKYGRYSELHLISYTYLKDSLKNAEMNRRMQEVEPVKYKLELHTRFKDVQFRKLLSRVATKDESTEILSKSILEMARSRNINVTVAFQNEAHSTVLNTDYLRSNHEEADTKLLHMPYMLRNEELCISEFVHQTLMC